MAKKKRTAIRIKRVVIWVKHPDGRRCTMEKEDALRALGACQINGPYGDGHYEVQFNDERNRTTTQEAELDLHNPDSIDVLEAVQKVLRD